jgi:hypothetical protein
MATEGASAASKLPPVGKQWDGRPFSVQVVDQHLHFGTLMPLRVGAFIPLLTPVAPAISAEVMPRASRRSFSNATKRWLLLGY